MTNIYTLSNSLNPVFEKALLRIVNAITPLEVPNFIAGATARDIVLHGIFGRLADNDGQIQWPPSHDITM